MAPLPAPPPPSGIFLTWGELWAAFGTMAAAAWGAYRFQIAKLSRDHEDIVASWKEIAADLRPRVESLEQTVAKQGIEILRLSVENARLHEENRLLRELLEKHKGPAVDAGPPSSL